MKPSVRQFLFILLLPWMGIQGQTVSDIVAMIRKGDTRQAKTALSQIKDDPENFLFLNGLLATDGDSAVFYYEKLLQSYPTSRYGDDVLFRLAQLKYAQGLYKTAHNRFLRLVKAYPQSPLHQSCYYWMALCFQATGQTDSSIVQLQRVIDHFPRTPLSKTAQETLEFLKKQKTPEIKETTSTLRYSVQVGAFSHHPNALRRKSFFEREGHRVDLRTKIKEGEVLYLVWVGSFDSREKARAFGEKLKSRYGVQYQVVSE